MEAALDTQHRSAPAHVPPHLVYDYDRFTTPALYESPQFALSKRLREEAPPIFFTPHQQMWVVSKPALVANMLQRYDLFSSDPEYCLWRREHPTRTLPPTYDPPGHAEARKVVTPLFTPKSVAAMEPAIRRLSIEIIEDVLAKGQCEFVSEVGKRFPVTVFLTLADAPLADREALIEMVERYLRSPDKETSLSGARDLAAYLFVLVEERSKALGDDLISRILRGTMEGRPLTHDEVLGAAYFMFLAGLDTVASVFSFAMRFLARNPGHYTQLVQEPTLIKEGIEELLRVSGVAMPERAATGDFVYEGVPFRKHDHVLLLSSLSGLDPAEISTPERVDFQREDNRHAIFGNGPHRCLGSHLARLEIRVFLEEWVRRVPRFSITDDQPIEVLGGIVWIPAALPLTLGR
ncbi:MAG: cytochrome P450 [Hyphomonadaceae bacterium]